MELANQNRLDVPPLGTDEQSLLEQVCANLDLPLSIITSSTPSQPSRPSWQDIDAPLPSDQIATDPPQSQPNLAMMPIQGVTACDDFSQTDPNVGLQMQNWTDIPALQPWDGSPSDWTWQVLNDFTVFPTNTASQLSPGLQPGNPAQHDGLGSSGTSDDEGEEGIIPSFAARFGSLRRTPDGRLRYFGTASNRHFLKDFDQHQNYIDAEGLHQAAATALENAQLDQEVPSALENHLIELFFAWHNPCHLTVSRPVFETALARAADGQSEYCSRSLVAAM